jgi:N utilization substance protein B
LQALCVFDALGELFDAELDPFLNDRLNHADLGWKRRPGPNLTAFARALAMGAWQHRAASDQLLKEHVLDWSIDRMQPVDRSILRLGLYELLERPDTPAPVVINEAVELARVFGGTESPAFVNGVLDGLRRQLARDDAPVAEPVAAPGESAPDTNVGEHDELEAEG